MSRFSRVLLCSARFFGFLLFSGILFQVTTLFTNNLKLNKSLLCISAFFIYLPFGFVIEFFIREKSFKIIPFEGITRKAQLQIFGCVLAFSMMIVGIVYCFILMVDVDIRESTNTWLFGFLIIMAYDLLIHQILFALFQVMLIRLNLKKKGCHRIFILRVIGEGSIPFLILLFLFKLGFSF